MREMHVAAVKEGLGMREMDRNGDQAGSGAGGGWGGQRDRETERQSDKCAHPSRRSQRGVREREMCPYGVSTCRSEIFILNSVQIEVVHKGRPWSLRCASKATS